MSDQIPYQGFEAAEFAENPEPRVPCVLLLDISGSMSGRPIDELNSALVSFKPKAGVPDAERAVVDQRHFPRMRQLEAVLSDGPRQLREIVRQNNADRNLQMNQIQTIICHVFQARADVEIMDRVLEGRRRLSA